jgi:hypothetical protein
MSRKNARYIYSEEVTQVNPTPGMTSGTQSGLTLRTQCNYWRLEITTTANNESYLGIIVNGGVYYLPVSDQGGATISGAGKIVIESGACRPDTWIDQPVHVSDIPGKTNGILTASVSFTFDKPVSVVFTRGRFDIAA